MTASATTTAVLFDFYGTLATAARAARWWESVFALRGHELDPTVLDRWDVRAWDGTTHHDHSRDEAAYRAWERHRWQRAATDHGVTGGERDELVDELERWRDRFTMVAYDDAAPVLAALGEAGHRLIVCSNWDWDLDKHLEATGLADLVHDRVSSAWVGSRKPHPLIYEETLALAGSDPAETVFVGDTWDADILGPLDLGMTPVHVHRPDSRKAAPPLPDGVHRVTDLTGLLRLLS